MHAKSYDPVADLQNGGIITMTPAEAVGFSLASYVDERGLATLKLNDGTVMIFPKREN